MAKKKPLSFEDNLKKLEGIAHELERPQTSLEEGLQLFEQGIELIQTLQATLATAEKRVALVLKNGETITETPFETMDEDE